MYFDKDSLRNYLLEGTGVEVDPDANNNVLQIIEAELSSDAEVGIILSNIQVQLKTIDPNFDFNGGAAANLAWQYAETKFRALIKYHQQLVRPYPLSRYAASNFLADNAEAVVRKLTPMAADVLPDSNAIDVKITLASIVLDNLYDPVDEDINLTDFYETFDLEAPEDIETQVTTLQAITTKYRALVAAGASQADPQDAQYILKALNKPNSKAHWLPIIRAQAADAAFSNIEDLVIQRLKLSATATRQELMANDFEIADNLVIPSLNQLFADGDNADAIAAQLQIHFADAGDFKSKFKTEVLDKIYIYRIWEEIKENASDHVDIVKQFLSNNLNITDAVLADIAPQICAEDAAAKLHTLNGPYVLSPSKGNNFATTAEFDIEKLKVLYHDSTAESDLIKETITSIMVNLGKGGTREEIKLELLRLLQEPFDDDNFEAYFKSLVQYKIAEHIKAKNKPAFPKDKYQLSDAAPNFFSVLDQNIKPSEIEAEIFLFNAIKSYPDAINAFIASQDHDATVTNIVTSLADQISDAKSYTQLKTFFTADNPDGLYIHVDDFNTWLTATVCDKLAPLGGTMLYGTDAYRDLLQTYLTTQNVDQPILNIYQDLIVHNNIGRFLVKIGVDAALAQTEAAFLPHTHNDTTIYAVARALNSPILNGAHLQAIKGHLQGVVNLNTLLESLHQPIGEPAAAAAIIKQLLPENLHGEYQLLIEDTAAEIYLQQQYPALAKVFSHNILSSYFGAQENEYKQRYQEYLEKNLVNSKTKLPSSTDKRDTTAKDIQRNLMVMGIEEPELAGEDHSQLALDIFFDVQYQTLLQAKEHDSIKDLRDVFSGHIKANKAGFRAKIVANSGAVKNTVAEIYKITGDNNINLSLANLQQCLTDVAVNIPPDAAKDLYVLREFTRLQTRFMAGSPTHNLITAQAGNIQQWIRLNAEEAEAIDQIADQLYSPLKSFDRDETTAGKQAALQKLVDNDIIPKGDIEIPELTEDALFTPLRKDLDNIHTLAEQYDGESDEDFERRKGEFEAEFDASAKNLLDALDAIAKVVQDDETLQNMHDNIESFSNIKQYIDNRPLTASLATSLKGVAEAAEIALQRSPERIAMANTQMEKAKEIRAIVTSTDSNPQTWLPSNANKLKSKAEAMTTAAQHYLKLAETREQEARELLGLIQEKQEHYTKHVHGKRVARSEIGVKSVDIGEFTDPNSKAANAKIKEAIDEHIGTTEGFKPTPSLSIAGKFSPIPFENRLEPQKARTYFIANMTQDKQGNDVVDPSSCLVATDFGDQYTTYNKLPDTSMDPLHGFESFLKDAAYQIKKHTKADGSVAIVLSGKNHGQSAERFIAAVSLILDIPASDLKGINKAVINHAEGYDHKVTRELCKAVSANKDAYAPLIDKARSEINRLNPAVFHPGPIQGIKRKWRGKKVMESIQSAQDFATKMKRESREEEGEAPSPKRPKI